MATHSGFTAGGKHFTETLTTRMGNPLVTYHVDGKRVTERAWFAEVKAAQQADRIKKLAAEQLARLGDLLAILEGDRDTRARPWTTAESDEFVDLAPERIKRLESIGDGRTDAEEDEYDTLVALT